MLGDPALIAAERESAGRERFDDHARLQHATSIESIGDVSGDQHQQERRNELGKPDEPEVERAARQSIDLPADADRQHLVRDHRGDAREPEQNE